MVTFLSRIKGTVRSAGRDGARSKSTGDKRARGRGARGGSPGPRGSGGRGRSAGGATSKGAGGRSRTAGARARPAAKAGAGSAGRAKRSAGPGRRGTKGSGGGGGSRPEGAKQRPGDGRQEAGGRTADVARHGPATPVRVLAMLVAFAAMVAFAGVLSRLTLEPSAASEALAHTNLRPGASIRAYLSAPGFQDTVKQLGGNIVLGVPFGVLLPVLLPRARGLVRVTAVTALVMLLVELAQGALIDGRAFDIDDVILNSTGAFLGYLLLGRRLGRAVHPPRRRWWQRWMRGPVAG